MPCNYNPLTNEVETLLERYQREYLIEELMLQQSTDEKIDSYLLQRNDVLEEE